MSENGESTIIMTNDDGIDAPGIAWLRVAMQPFGHLVAVAPSGPCSGCGHALTTHQPIRVQKRANDAFAVDGTPADCTRLALKLVTPAPRWIVSGINAGGNLGCDIYPSGTVAAAREAAIAGCAAIAFSQYIRQELPIDWPRAAAWTARVMSVLAQRPLPPGTFWNVNFPSLAPTDPEPEIVFCPVDLSAPPSEYRTDGELWTYCGKYRDRARRPNLDIATCFGGAISVSLLDVRTHANPF